MADIKRVKDLRIDNDMTQENVAKKLKINSRTYAYYEQGQRMIPIDVLIALSNLYSVSIDYMLSLTDVKERIK